MSTSTPDVLEEAKFRALLVSRIMEAFGPEYERAAEQLTERVVKNAMAFHTTVPPTTGLITAADARRHVDRVQRAGLRAIYGSVYETLKLVKQVRLDRG